MEDKDRIINLLKGGEEWELEGFISGINVDHSPDYGTGYTSYSSHTHNVSIMPQASHSHNRTTVRVEFIFECDPEEALNMMTTVRNTNIMDHEKCLFVITKKESKK